MISDGLKRFLTRVLDKDPTKRYTVDQMKKDEWVNDGMPSLAPEMIHHRLSALSPKAAGGSRRPSTKMF